MEDHRLIHKTGLFNNGRLILGGIFLLALVLRLLMIAGRPIWYDEAFAVLFSEKGPSAMLAGTLAPDASGAAADVHPLAYYTLLWLWMKGFGESLVSVRLLSVLSGMGIVVLAYFLCRALFQKEWLAWMAALGAALSPFLVHYSQEIRMYAQLAFILTGATFVFWKGLQTDQRRWWVWFAVLAAAAQYTQNLAFFYLIPLALTPVLLRRWKKVLAVFISGAGAILLYLPWLVQLPNQFSKIHHAYWIERPGADRIFSTLLSYVTGLPVTANWLPVALVVTVLVVFLALFQTYQAIRRRQLDALRGGWLAYLAFAPAGLMFLFSQWQPVYIERALLPSGVMFWIWLIWAFLDTSLPRPIQYFGSIALVPAILIGLATHLNYHGFAYAPYQALDTSLRSRVQPGDVILHSNKLSMLPAVYFDRSLDQSYLADPPGSGSDTLAPATQRVLGLMAVPTLEQATRGTRRVYFIIFQEALKEAADAGLSEHPHLAWLDEHFRLESVERWDTLLVYVYVR